MGPARLGADRELEAERHGTLRERAELDAARLHLDPLARVVEHDREGRGPGLEATDEAVARAPERARRDRGLVRVAEDEVHVRRRIRRPAARREAGLHLDGVETRVVEAAL